MSKNGFYKTVNEAVRALYSYSFQNDADEEDLRRIFLENASMQDGEKELGGMDPLLCPAGILAKGALEKQAELDLELKPYLRGWKLERLGILELSLLRAGLFAIKYQRQDVKTVLAVVRKIASEYGLEQARRFLTGVFAAWVRDNLQESG